MDPSQWAQYQQQVAQRDQPLVKDGNDNAVEYFIGALVGAGFSSNFSQTAMKLLRGKSLFELLKSIIHTDDDYKKEDDDSDFLNEAPSQSDPLDGGLPPGGTPSNDGGSSSNDTSDSSPSDDDMEAFGWNAGGVAQSEEGWGNPTSTSGAPSSGGGIIDDLLGWVSNRSVHLTTLPLGDTTANNVSAPQKIRATPERLAQAGTQFDIGQQNLRMVASFLINHSQNVKSGGLGKWVSYYDDAVESLVTHINLLADEFEQLSILLKAFSDNLLQAEKDLQR